MSNLLLADPSTRGHRSQLCQALMVSRATVYRHRQQENSAAQRDLCMRAHIKRIASDYKDYGYRRITAQLQREGILVNHKKVLFWMRKDKLLCLPKKRFIATTDSAHGRPVYPNLRPHICLCRLNQLWVADITYIRLARGFIYLAVVLDAFSRRCIGWALATHLHASLAVEALDMALSYRPAPEYHHSDQGVQYASQEYVSRLVAQRVQISMSRKGNPYDNAYAESFMKTLKYEEVHSADYETIADVRESLPYFIEQVYNQKRLHSALGYMPPVEFEQKINNQYQKSPYLTVSL